MTVGELKPLGVYYQVSISPKGDMVVKTFVFIREVSGPIRQFGFSEWTPFSEYRKDDGYASLHLSCFLPELNEDSGQYEFPSLASVDELIDWIKGTLEFK